MKTIYKYPLDMGETKLSIPHSAKLVHVDAQNDQVCLWFEVHSDRAHEERRFKIFGTGHAIDAQNWHHVGSVLTLGGALVWHVYEYNELI